MHLEIASVSEFSSYVFLASSNGTLLRADQSRSSLVFSRCAQCSCCHYTPSCFIPALLLVVAESRKQVELCWVLVRVCFFFGFEVSVEFRISEDLLECDGEVTRERKVKK